MSYDKYFKKNRPSISMNTIKSYSTTLRGLGKKLGKAIESPKDIINNIDNVIKAYDDVKFSSRKTHMSALISFIDDGKDDDTKQAVDKLRKLVMTDVKTYDDFINSQEKSKQEEENWISWDDVIKRYQSFEREVAALWKLKPEELSKGNFNKLKLFVLLSCYILIPPRRLLDYTSFKIRNFNLTKDNYMKGKTFIFNNYKTAKTYGTNVVDISPKLFSIIKKWIAINDSDFLITGNNDRFKQISAPQLTNMLNTFFNKRVSVNILRHSFLTHLYKDIPDLKDMKERASDMGHDIETAISYIKK